jgi:hypothetical protein
MTLYNKYTSAYNFLRSSVCPIDIAISILKFVVVVVAT